MFLIVGLGNPGRKYQKTKHNVGFMVIDELAQMLAVKNKEFSKIFGSQAVKTIYKRHRLILAKPQTFMNLNGPAVNSLLHYYKVASENLIVVHDDLDLDFGRLKIKFSGGTAGHNGLKSLTEALGSGDFIRVRIGIGRGPKGAEKDYVLDKFAAGQKKELEAIIKQAGAAVLAIVEGGYQKAMNLFNG